MSHNPWSDDEFAAAEKWIALHWEPRHAKAAMLEGWNIWDSQGSENSPWQIQRYDSPDDVDGVEVPELASDEEAWLRVRTGTGEHHSLARHFLFMYVPEHEWKYINEWYAKEYPENAT